MMEARVREISRYCTLTLMMEGAVHSQGTQAASRGWNGLGNLLLYSLPKEGSPADILT